MSDPGTKAVRLLLMEIRVEQDLVLCRQRARQLAAGLGFSPQAQIRVATALSEIARNAYQYAGGGRVEFRFESEQRFATPNTPRQSLSIVVRDEGPGVVTPEKILDGQYRSATGLGLGLLGAKRLMDALELQTSPAGTAVTMRKTLPPGSRIFEPAEVQKMVDALRDHAPASAIEEMQMQNQELLRAMEESRQREEEIHRINDELAQTNAGVLALYDELETLHRVSVLLAAELDLNTLIQSIIDVTTDLTDADFGAFFFRSEGGEHWTLNGVAGPARQSLSGLGQAHGEDFFGPDFGSDGVLRHGDLETQPAPCCVSKFAELLAPHFTVRSCLAVPIVAASGNVLGAMVFAAGQPARFTERSERIVGSIAAQAVVGIEKSRLYQEVKASSEAKDRFLAMLSHELRTPLNPVLATVTSWLGEERVPPELREEVALVVRNVRLEARLIDDLLDFNKLINGKLKLDHSLVDLHDVIESAVEICRADATHGRLELAVELAAARAGVEGDAARLQQVLWNLLKNAIKFTPARGRIAVRTSNPRPGLLRIEVCDTGRGIEPEALTRIFGAFEQGPPQVLASFGGLGLGLAIAKTFVERHGGTIRAASAGAGHGAQMIIELPLSDTPVMAAALSPAAPSAAAMGNVPARILLVDDHEDTLVTLTRLLKRRGHTVTAAATAAAARAEFARSEFDVIISDLGLPDASGLDLLIDLRAIRVTPAIALSGYGMDSDLLGSKAAGFEEHLTKPIDFERLARAIQQLVPAARAAV